MKKMIKQRLDELRYEVNSLDNLYNTNFRNPFPIVDPKLAFKITVSNYEIYLIDLLCSINNIDPANYIFVTEHGTLCANEFKLDKKFKELSCLGMDDKFKDSTDSLAFHGRFISYIIYHYLSEIREMIKDIYDEMGGKKVTKYDNYLIILNQIIKNLNMLVITYLSSDASYTEYMKALIDIRLVRDCNPKKKKFAEWYNNEAEYIRTSCKSNIFGKRAEDDSTLINDITKMAYMLSTENTKFKHCGTVDSEIRFSNKKEIKEILGRLGYAILLNRSKNNINPIYKAYLKSKPEINTNIREVNKYIELSAALEALEYEKIIIDDPNVSSVIDSLILG